MDQLAVITGGSSGIGQAICWRLAAEGARIAILDVNPADETCAQLERSNAEHWFRLTDVLKPPDIANAFGELEAELGSPDILVNAAGVYAQASCLETTPELWDWIMNINARGLYFCSQEAARRMRSKGGGRIINILATGAEVGYALGSAYCASKAAATLITKTLAIELGPDNILVNGVSPGTIRTKAAEPYIEAAGGPHKLLRTPLGRIGETGDVAEAVAFLATRASWITGEVINVDGGYLVTGLPLPEGREL